MYSKYIKYVLKKSIMYKIKNNSNFMQISIVNNITS